MKTRWIRECIKRVDGDDEFNVGVVEQAILELEAIEKKFKEIENDDSVQVPSD